LQRGDFFISPSNALALSMLEEWPAWPNNCHILTGPEGGGKTHLAHVWAATSGAQILNASDLPNQEIATLSQASLVVENIPNISGNRAAEEALFHLLNLIKTGPGRLLLTGRENALFWKIKLPDLASRLAGARSAELHAPDDILFAALLVKLFADRQLFPNPDAIQYLVTRIERSFKSAQIIVAQIDRIALSKQQAVTRNLISKILASADHSSD
tara:strand:+ start:721 stop:1362 length:642 start_codon:yes stop_codon:yes gene_type:complete